MAESRNRSTPQPRKVRDDTTVRDGELTNTLAKRLAREVALERASQTARLDHEIPESRVPVVLGADGVPRVADDDEVLPESAVVEVQDAPPPPRKPPPLPPRKR